MFCGSCMHDNTLVRGLARQGWDLQLVPTYTPIRTDEDDVSVDQVFFGGVNIYLQQKIPMLRHLPATLDRFLDNPWLIRKVTSRALETDASTLGKLAYSMLLGMQGNQRKEVTRLCRWLATVAQPDLLVLSNMLIGGCLPEIKKQLDIPILVTLQGDDVFLDSLPEPYRANCISRIGELSDCVDGFLVHTNFFKSYMSDYFGIEPEKMHVIPLGIDVSDFHDLQRDPVTSPQLNLGYLARMSPEKGLHHLVDAFVELRNNERYQHVQLKLAGWLGPQHKDYVDEQFKKLDEAGLAGDYEYLGSLDRHSKLKFLGSLDLFSVPTDFLEPKGLYALEAMAAGVPIIQPRHGSFPEMISATSGGLLFDPGDRRDFVSRLVDLIEDSNRRREMSKQGRQSVLEQRNMESMSISTGQWLQRFLSAE